MIDNYETVQKVFVEFPSGEVSYYTTGSTFKTTRSQEYRISEIRIDENEVAIYGYNESTDYNAVLLGRFIGAPFLADYAI